MNFKTFAFFSIFFTSSAIAGNQVITVAKSGGQFTDPISAVNSIVDASKFKPYVINVEPGTYWLLGEKLVLKPFVSIAGSSASNTIIQSFVDGCVIEGHRSEISNLTVRNLGVHAEGSEACGLSELGMITNVNVVVDGSADLMTGIYSSEKIINSSIYLRNNRTNSRSIGVNSFGTTTNLNNSTIIAVSTGLGSIAQGVYSYESGVNIFNSAIRTAAVNDDNALVSDLSAFNIRNSRLFSNHGATLLASGNRGGWIRESEILSRSGEAIVVEFSGTGAVDTRIQVINSVVEGDVNKDLAESLKCSNVIDEELNPISC